MTFDGEEGLLFFFFFLDFGVSAFILGDEIWGGLEVMEVFCFRFLLLQQEDEEMLVPHSEFADTAAQPMDGTSLLLPPITPCLSSSFVLV